MRASWVRRWFARQDDVILWAILLVWVIVQIRMGLWLLSLVAEAIA